MEDRKIFKHRVQTPSGEVLSNQVELLPVSVKWNGDEFEEVLILISGLSEEDDRLLVFPLIIFDRDHTADEEESRPIILNTEKSLLDSGPTMNKYDHTNTVDMALLDRTFVHYGIKKFSTNYTII